jgi:serine/threonine protein kinase
MREVDNPEHELMKFLNHGFAGRYKFLEVIGCGTSQGVYFVKRILPGTQVAESRDNGLAAKVIHKDSLEGVDCSAIQESVRMPPHPAVIKYHEIDDKSFQHNLVIFMEYFNGMPLNRFVQCEEHSTADLQKIADQMMQGLHHIHTNRFVHGDIKPDNLLVSKNLELKIIDWGIGNVVNMHLDHSEYAAGYRAPELKTGAFLDPRMDMFSTGVLLYELFSGDIAGNFRSLSEHVANARMNTAKHELTEDALEKIKMRKDSYDPGTLPKETMGRLDKVIRKCLNYNPAERYHCMEELRVDFNKAFED